MVGMVFGSVGTPFSPWQAAQSCAFASIPSCACAGTTAARPSPAPKTTESKRVSMAIFPPDEPEAYHRRVTPQYGYSEFSKGELHAQTDIGTCRRLRSDRRSS